MHPGKRTKEKNTKREQKSEIFLQMLLILIIIVQNSLCQTIFITKYEEKIYMKNFAACHLYDYVNETNTIVVKIADDHKFLDINDIQIGISHIYLPLEVHTERNSGTKEIFRINYII